MVRVWGLGVRVEATLTIGFFGSDRSSTNSGSVCVLGFRVQGSGLRVWI